LCVHERDIKAKPSVTKSLPHQAPFAPQEELPQSAAVLLHPAKHRALPQCARRHHLMPRLHRCVSVPGEIRHCSHVCAAAMSRPGTLALQPPLHRCILTPGKMPGAAAMCVQPPHHAWGLWRCSHFCAAASQLLVKPWRCSHVCAAAMSCSGTSSCWVLTPLQPCTHCRHVTPGDIGAAATTAPLRLDARQNARQNARRCSHVRAATMSHPGTLALQPLLRHCVSMPGKMPLCWANLPAKSPALR
jgi:hypothetical protein